MRILVACEESQAVTIELRRLGHEAYSCDIIECSGDSFEKTTCLWLIGLAPLVPTNIVDRGEFIRHKSGKVKPKWFADALSLPPEERAKVRRKTFPGIAKAMAEQWAGVATESAMLVGCGGAYG